MPNFPDNLSSMPEYTISGDGNLRFYTSSDLSPMIDWSKILEDKIREKINEESQYLRLQELVIILPSFEYNISIDTIRETIASAHKITGEYLCKYRIRYKIPSEQELIIDIIEFECIERNY